jgi:hypothetical protein
MEIRYNRWVAGILLALGGLNLILAVWLMLVVKTVPVSLITALIVAFLGWMYWQRPYFIVEQDYVVAPALVGPLKREFLFRSPQDVKIEDGKLMVRNEGEWKRVPVYRWLSHPDDWQQMAKHVQSLSVSDEAI